MVFNIIFEYGFGLFLNKPSAKSSEFDNQLYRKIQVENDKPKSKLEVCNKASFFVAVDNM